MKQFIADEESLKSNLSKNLRHLRLSREPSLSQAMLAKRLGVTQKSISKYEQEHCLPPLHILVSMADYFSLTIEDLLYGSLAEKEGNEIKE